MSIRAKLDVDGLLRILLLLVVALVALELVQEVLSMALGPLSGTVRSLVGLALLAILALWLLDRV